MVAKDDLFQVGFKLIKLVQEHPYHVPLQAKFLRVFNLSLIFFLMVLSVINITKVKGQKFFRTGEALAMEFQTTTKYLTIIYFQPDFTKLYKYMDLYWKIEEAEPKTAKLLKSYFKFMKSLLLGLVYSSIVTVFILYWKPLIMHKEGEFMVLECWVPDVYFLTSRNLLICQYWVMFTIEAIIIGFDCIFGALAFHLYVQFIYLNSELRSLYMDRTGDVESDRKAQEKLRKCILYHKFLLEDFTLMARIYFYHFMCQYFSTVVNTCMEFYLLVDSITNFDALEVIKSLSFLSCLLFEFTFFCFPAEYIYDEIISMSDAIYESRWYESKLKYQRQLLIVMMKAQRPPKFTAGGFSVVDIKMFTTVFKAAFSFFTIMRNLFDK